MVSSSSTSSTPNRAAPRRRRRPPVQAVQPAPGRQALTVKEAAWELNCHPNTVGNLIKSGELESFMSPQWTEYLLSVSDPNGRPILLPTSGQAALPIQQAPNGGPPPGFTGDRIVGLPLLSDGNIPPVSGHTQILVANMGEVFTQLSEPVNRCIPETLAPDLSVVVQTYAMLGVIVRHANAVQVITGSSYPTNPTFA
jgi:hypothetical protein